MPSLSCTICSEVYTATDVIYSTACGHIFHFACMQQWRSRSTSCPQCREHNPTTHRIFLDFEESANEQKLNEIQTLLDQTQVARSELQLQLDDIERNFYDMQRLLVDTEEKNVELESANQYLKAQNESREDEINKLINNCTTKSLEEVELLRTQLTSLEERQKEIILELEQKSEECIKLNERINNCDKQEKMLQRNEVLYESTRKQYEAVEKGLKVQIEHLQQDIISKAMIIEKHTNTIEELNAKNKTSNNFADISDFDGNFEKQKLNQYIDNNSTEMLMQKFKLERELEKSTDKIMELEECLIRSKEMQNIEIDSLKADIVRKDNEIKNRKDEHAKMMDRLSTLGSKATEISLRKRNEILVNKLEETRCDLEKAFKKCSEKDAAILKLKQTESLAKLNLGLLPDQKVQKKIDDSATIDKTLNNTLAEEEKKPMECNNGKNVTSVFLTGVPEEDIKKPLINTVLMYTEIMSIPCQLADIVGVYHVGSQFVYRNNDRKVINNLLIKFVNIDMKVKFLVNKEKLKTRGVRAAEHREEKEKNSLYHYAKTLKIVGYSTIFCKNNIVFARLNKTSPLIKINNKREVDSLLKESQPPVKNITEECDNAYYRK